MKKRTSSLPQTQEKSQSIQEKNSNKMQWLKENILPVFFLTVVGCASFLWVLYTSHFSAQNNPVATVSLRGEVVLQVDLTQIEGSFLEEITQEGGYYNKIQISPNEIAMIEANCPDQVCVLQGASTHSGRPIICLPHQIIITFQGKEEEEIDGFTG